MFGFDPDSMASYYAEQGFDAMLSGEEDEQPVSCRYCKKDGFYWASTSQGWRLTTETGEIHSCSKYTRAQWLKTGAGESETERIGIAMKERFKFEGDHHLWDELEGCYWIRERDAEERIREAIAKAIREASKTNPKEIDG